MNNILEPAAISYVIQVTQQLILNQFNRIYLLFLLLTLHMIAAQHECCFYYPRFMFRAKIAFELVCEIFRKKQGAVVERRHFLYFKILSHVL